MAPRSRRSFLKISAAAIGGFAASTTVTATTSPDRYLVRTRRNADLRRVRVVHGLPGTGYAVVRGAERDVRAVAADYAPDVELRFDRPSPRATETTDEPLYPLQWDKQVLDVPDAHEVTRGEGTRVAVIDSGVASGHPDLSHAVDESLSQNFTGDPYGAGGPYGGYHGTHVAGIVAANDQNDAGVVGTAPGTEIVDCRVFSPGRLANFGDVLAAVLYSASVGCDVANLSIGAYPVPRNEGKFGQFYGQMLNAVTTRANREGTLLVVSAGNDAADLQHDGRVAYDVDGDGEVELVSAISVPNEAAQAMSIAATGPVGFNWGSSGFEASPWSPANYTNYGTNAVDLAAPGGDYDPSFPDGWYYDLVLNAIAEPTFDGDGNYVGADYGYGWVAGTSMAAPQVAGAAALVKSANPGYGPNRIESALERAADVPDGYDKAYYGSGFLDVVDAL